MKNQNPSAEDDFSIDFDPSTLDDSGKKVYETLNKQFREAYLMNTGSLAENPRIRMRVDTSPRLSVQRLGVDQRGVARPANAPSDIGAIEVP